MKQLLNFAKQLAVAFLFWKAFQVWMWFTYYLLGGK